MNKVISVRDTPDCYLQKRAEKKKAENITLLLFFAKS